MITGFNTFLPPGYKIEARHDNTIKVTTPNILPPILPPPSNLFQHQQQQPPPPVQPAPTAPVAPPKKHLEFNHAISYVNKIKQRFAPEPEKYKQFLEILQTYKQSKPIQEVYAQVQELFKGAPDLLDEFKQFLPDLSGKEPRPSVAGELKINLRITTACEIVFEPK